ncbi:hypothetical protein GCM10025869_01250 [Homoserinibacter gongjuensis]|uniref:Uncharacterized protein n=1 Tax=Homoserinibacter gongjuensis TaxID=1162968 RepID=A0ABQ6JPV1_9MICO|nr:hypothetical protein GCM10025869_01250 [Homoserinibacter gongjuensis]
MPGIAEMLLQGLTELESGVVGRDVDAHPPSLRGPPDTRPAVNPRLGSARPLASAGEEEHNRKEEKTAR